MRVLSAMIRSRTAALDPGPGAPQLGPVRTAESFPGHREISDWNDLPSVIRTSLGSEVAFR